MERAKGIEPTRPAWKAGVLPLNYTCIFLLSGQISPNCKLMLAKVRVAEHLKVHQ